MRALVLSGGGSKAAFQLGVLKHLIEREGRDYDIYCGSSSGALNASILAQSRLDESYLLLNNLWKSIKSNKDVYKNNKIRFSILLTMFLFVLGIVPVIISSYSLLYGILFFIVYLFLLIFPIKYILELESIYDKSPLKKKLIKNFDYHKIISNNKKLRIGVVNYEFGKYESIDEYNSELTNYILASASFPLFFEMEKINGQHWSDGGIINLAPVSDAIKAGATEIDIIICSNLEPSIEENKNLSHQFVRFLELMSTEVLKNDLAIIDASTKMRVFYPLDNLDFNYLDFNQDNIEKAIALGESSAKIILDSKKYKSWTK